MSKSDNSNPLHVSNILDGNFWIRALSSLIFGGIALYILITESAYLGYFMSLICVGVIYEWLRVVFTSEFEHKHRLAWLLTVSAYMLCGLFGFYRFYDYAPMLGLSVLAIIWATDIGAYFAGRIMGGPKLAPTISPGKTWSGALGGTLCALGVGMIITVYLYDGMNWWMFAFFALVSLLGQIGDLLESKVKRIFNIKDSGVFMPGHGGLIDRLDSLFLVGALLFIVHIIAGFQDVFQF